MAGGYRQEVFNVLLAQILHERGVISAPEVITKATPEGLRRMPDVIVTFQGLRTVIEGEVSDSPDARGRALASARKRVEEGIAHIAVAVVYPEELRRVDYGALKGRLAGSALEIAVITESGDGGFMAGDIGLLENTLRRTFAQLMEEDVVAKAVAAIEYGIEMFASVLAIKPGDLTRSARILGIRALPSKGRHEEEPE